MLATLLHPQHPHDLPQLGGHYTALQTPQLARILQLSLQPAHLLPQPRLQARLSGDTLFEGKEERMEMEIEMGMVQGERLLLQANGQDERELRAEWCQGTGRSAEVGVEGQFGEHPSGQLTDSGYASNVLL